MFAVRPPKPPILPTVVYGLVSYALGWGIGFWTGAR